MTRSYYHATPYENLGKILCEGIKAGIDGNVYLCETQMDAAKFVYIRGCRNIVVFEVLLDEGEVNESFEHSEAFFKCKAFVHSGDISFDNLTDKITQFKF